jgi:soluble lytic murein transglycosylase-like protein
MSLASVMGRIQELERLVAPPAPVPAPAAASPTGFAAQLAAARGPGAPAPATAVAAAAGGPTAYDGLIADAAARHGVDPALLKGLIEQESGFDPNAGSPAGARGLCQLMPGTAAGLGVSDPTDPAQAIEGGAKYLRQQLDAFGGDVTKALAAYNAGPGAVQRHGGVPPYAETQQYVQRVLAFAEQYRGAGASTPAPTAVAGAVAASPLDFGVV